MSRPLSMRRRAEERRTARAVGLREDQATLSVADQNAQRNQADIYALPDDVRSSPDLMDTDPSSPTFGSLYFLPGVDMPGNPNRVMPPYRP